MMRFNDIREVWNLPTKTGPAMVSLKSFIQEGHLYTTPDYQRGRVWTDAQASAFMGYFLGSGQIPPLVCQEWPTQEQWEVVDGLQRMTAIHRWAAGEIPATLEGFPPFFLSDFSEDDQRRVMRTLIPIQFIYAASRRQVLEIYLRLNGGGTPHTPEELDRVRGMLRKT